MSRHPAHHAIFAMETDIKDVRRWALVLAHMATSDNGIEGEELHVVSGVLFDIGKRLVEQWDEAFAATGGQS